MSILEPSPTLNLLFATALMYRDQHHFSVIPLAPHAQVPPTGAKVTPYRRRLATDQELQRWFADEAANLCLITGRISQLIVLDLDGPDGRQSIRGLPLPPTPNARTGHGQHAYFRRPEGHWPTRLKALPGVDLLADDAYVVAPTSVHPNGRPYRMDDCADQDSTTEILVEMEVHHRGRERDADDNRHYGFRVRVCFVCVWRVTGSLTRKHGDCRPD